MVRNKFVDFAVVPELIGFVPLPMQARFAKRSCRAFKIRADSAGLARIEPGPDGFYTLAVHVKVFFTQSTGRAHLDNTRAAV